MYARVQVDSGMGRLGVLPRDAAALLTALTRPDFHVEGIYTHFSRADDDVPYTLQQVCV